MTDRSDRKVLRSLKELRWLEGLRWLKGLRWLVGDLSCLTASKVKDYDGVLMISKNCLKFSMSFKVLRRFRGLKGFRVSQNI